MSDWLIPPVIGAVVAGAVFVVGSPFSRKREALLGCLVFFLLIVGLFPFLGFGVPSLVISVVVAGVVFVAGRPLLRKRQEQRDIRNRAAALFAMSLFACLVFFLFSLGLFFLGFGVFWWYFAGQESWHLMPVDPAQLASVVSISVGVGCFYLVFKVTGWLRSASQPSADLWSGN